MTQGIVWSVSIEEQFYLFWPLLFFLFPRRGYWTIFLIVILASCLFKVMNVSDGAVLYFHTLSVISDLAIGGLLAFLILNNYKFRIKVYEQSRPTIIAFYILIMVVIIFSNSIFVFKGGGIVYRILTDFLWGYIILEQNFAKRSFYKLGNSKTMTYWGKYTYGLYMLHPIAILIVDVIARMIHLKADLYWATGIAGIVSFFLSLLIAKLSYHLLEEPFLKLKERFTIIRNKSLKTAS
jgi:peptidoglycan/LPS O-acetylase OafA/YrhL